MARKRSDPEQVPEAATDPGYDIGEWKGLPAYRCRLCPYDTLDEREMRAHMEARHTVAAPPLRVIRSLSTGSATR
jgi:hypothetical protein